MAIKNSLLKNLQTIKTLPMVGVGLPFLLSSLFASLFQSATNIVIIIMLSIVACIILVILIVALFFSAQKRTQVIAVVIPFMIIVVACVTAFSLMYVKTEYEQAKVVSLLSSTEYDSDNANQSNQYTISGLVTDTFINDKGTHGFNVTVDNVINKSDVPKFKTILYSRTDIGVEPYTYITADVLLNPLNNTSSFDIKSYYKQDGIYLTGFIDGDIHSIEYRQDKIGYLFIKLNHTLKEKIDTYFSGDTASLLKAILLGDRSNMSDTLNHKLKLTGIMHITAISGLHTAIIAGAILWLLKRFILAVEFRHIITISAVWIFVALTGFNLSTVRAGIMITILLSAKIFGRRSNVLNSLFFAGIVIVLQNPFAILDIGFMMSFLATLGIVLLYKKLHSRISSKISIKNPIIDFMVKSMSITLSSTLFLLPVYMVYFNGFSAVSIITNIIAVPIGTVILIAGVIFLCFSLTPINIAIEFISIIINLFSNVFFLVCDVSSRLPFAFIGVDKNDVPIKLLLALAIIVMFIIYKRERKVLKTSALFTANFVMVVLIFSLFIRSNNVKIATISSYNSQAVVLSYRQNATIIALNSDSYINKQIVDYLDSLNIAIISDYILLEKNTKTVADIEYMNEFKYINNYVLDNSNQISLFLNRYYSESASIHSISDLSETRLFADIKASFAYDESNSAVQLEINGNTVCISSKAELLSRFKRKNDIIFLADKKFTNFSEENTLQNEIFGARCVIIICECPINYNDTFNTKFINANSSSVCLKIKSNGDYEVIKF